MAKGVGLIGNFKGKVGNTVGYSLKDSNNKQTQGIRVYQPVVRNPKTYAQAEQRAKLAPINATYRALKMIIDRGQEGLAYGNKSRLAWLSDAIKKFDGAYFIKGAAITDPAMVPLTKGSLNNPVSLRDNWDDLGFPCAGVTSEGTTTIGALATAILAAYPSLKNGDQLTFICVGHTNDALNSFVVSIVLDTTSTAVLPSAMRISEDSVSVYAGDITHFAGAIILSREGENGAHLRSSEILRAGDEYIDTNFTDAAKEAAIVSYMSQGANTDWAEESIMQ